jgi:hypothetical protein
MEWRNQYSLLRKCKIYYRGSEVFRHNAPFSDVWHAALSFPFDSVKSLFAHAPTISNQLKNRLEKEAKLVRERTHLARAETLYDLILPEKAYGPRVEITLQNPTLEELILAYDNLKEFSDAVLCLFNVTKAVYQCGMLPREILRCCPIQAVRSTTLCSIPRKFSRSIANYFYRLLDYITSAGNLQAFTYNDHFVRLAFLLQDQLTFIWSGSVQSLLHPTLFERYKQRQSVLQYGHFFVSPNLLVPDLVFSRARLHNISRDDEEDDDQIDLLDIGLPPRFIYTLFPETEDRICLDEILLNVRLCMCSSTGIVEPADKSLGSILAANLVNSLFTAFFAAANILTPVKQRKFLSLLQGKDRDAIDSFLQQEYLKKENVYPVQVSFQDAYVSIADITDVAFPDATFNWESEDDEDRNANSGRLYRNTPVKLVFAKQWQLAKKSVIAQLNERLKAGSAKGRALEQIRANTTDIITLATVIQKIRGNLDRLALKYFPVFSTNTFWGFHGKFKLTRVIENAAPRILRVIGGKPMISADNQIIDNEAKIRLLRHICLKSSLVTGVRSRAELLTHCTYHAFKKTTAKPEYHNMQRKYIFATGLFPYVPDRVTIVPAPDEVWRATYDKIFGKEN